MRAQAIFIGLTIWSVSGVTAAAGALDALVGQTRNGCWGAEPMIAGEVARGDPPTGKPYETDGTGVGSAVERDGASQCAAFIPVEGGLNGYPASRVASIQKVLNQLGYDAGPEDGRWGPRTRAALRAFIEATDQQVEVEPSEKALNALLIEKVQTAGRSTERDERAPSTSLDLSGVRPVRPTKRPAIPARVKVEELTPRQVYDWVSASVYVVLTRTGGEIVKQGSAVAVSPYQAVTNCHVLEGAEAIAVGQSGEVSRAWRGFAAPTTDRCFLWVMDGSLNPVDGVRHAETLKVGERVYTIGGPRGLEKTLAEGLISGLREFKDFQVIQTTAPLSRGSSGGGLFDVYGNLIGITTAFVEGGQNLNFAIAADEFWR